MNLGAEKCEACRADSPRAEATERDELLGHIEGWQVIVVDGVEQLHRQYTFKDFAAALRFTNAVGAIAEQEDHHPTILTQWGSVDVSWWTHTIRGLHRNDFIMAARCDDQFGVISGR